MSKARLTKKELELIVGMLVAWKGRITWELLVERATPQLRRPFTRQGLAKNVIVATAFGQAKDRFRKGPKKRQPARDLVAELAFALQSIDTLRAEVAVLKAERHRLLERFATWLYNARSRGISESDLNSSLPEVDRDKSERER